MPKSNGKKRQSPSVERQIALALVAVLEDVDPTKIEESGSISTAREVLKTAGYGDLESIHARVKRIEAEIAEALKAQDGAKLAQLGAALDRAKSGKPPLATEKKPRTRKQAKATPASEESPSKPATSPTEKKTRKKKDETPSLLPEGVDVVCSSCKWKGVDTPGGACRDCGAALVVAEGEAANA